MNYRKWKRQERITDLNNKQAVLKVMCTGLLLCYIVKFL